MGIQLVLVTSHIFGHLNNVRDREREFLLVEEQSPMWRVAANISSWRQLTRGGPPAWRLDDMLTVPHCKKWPCYKTYLCMVPGLILQYDLSSGKGT